MLQYSRIVVLMTGQVDATATVALDHCTFIGQQRLRHMPREWELTSDGTDDELN